VRARRETRLASIVLVLIGLLASLALPGAGGADPSAQVLRGRQALLGSRAHAALLRLYSLDSRLKRSSARLTALRSETQALRTELEQVAREEELAHHAWRASVDALGANLRTLYEEGRPDAIAVLLGASSIDDAVTRLDELERSAKLNKETLEQARRARVALTRFQLRLEARSRKLHTLVAAAEDTTAALAGARAERAAYIGSLARQRTLTARRIARLATQAQTSASHALVAKTPEATVSLPTGQSTTPSAPPATAGDTITVTATGYSLGGSTSTGIPVGWGVVAVDPSVIPLGTRLTIPGYGEGVAADTGGGVQGTAIDLWFPTQEQALGWGKRTIMVTLH
jgi:peptidoglycan DL-endopeptidase CwlO